MQGNWSLSDLSFANISSGVLRSRPRPGGARLNPASAWDGVVFDEWSKFQLLHDRCITIFDKLETSLLVVGLLGNSLAVVTLMLGRHMRTPSFVYHKALVMAYLTYCLNFLIVKYVNLTLTIPSERRQLSYYNPVAAYYAAILNRVITSVCGYLALYTSLAISIDRFLALVMFNSYAKFNRHVVAYIWVGTSLFLSVGLHSWAPWLENDIKATAVELDKSANQTVMTYRHRESTGRDQLKPYLMAKDWCNLTVRFAYAILLTVLTCTVIYMFTQQQKRRSTLCNVSKRQLRRERSLFYLMIAVVIMAYIQVIPRESKRVLELIYPPEYVASKIEDQALPIATRRVYLLFGLYGFTFTTPILNLCTTIERSLLFYFYFALNHTFRREVLTLLHLKNFWRSVVVRLRSNTDMDNLDSQRTTTRQQSDELSSRGVPTGRDNRSLSTVSANGCAVVRAGKRQASDASYGTSECGIFLSPGDSVRRKVTKCGSFQTICSEYSTVV